jgi:hypothetical protein
MRTHGRKSSFTKTSSLLLVVFLSLILTGTVDAALFNQKISGNLASGGDVQSFEISPDGRYAVFLADARTNTVDELFSTPTTGGERILLSQELPPASVVQGFTISPDSQSVVYWTATTDTLCTGIYAVPITGGPVINLGGTVPDYKTLTGIAITADNRYTVYKLYHTEFLVSSFDVLWAAPLDGSGPVALTAQIIESAFIDFKVTPFGAGVVYMDNGSGRPTRLYHGDMLGTRVELAEDVRSFSITPDGDWVVYTKYFRWPEFELYSRPIIGGTPVKLSGPIVPGGGVQDFKIAPNSQHVVYRADQMVMDQYELFSVPVDGSTPNVKLLGAMNPNGDVDDYLITPNSLGVVYRADQVVDGRFDLGAVGISGGATYWLNKDMVVGGNVTAFAITPNSLGVVFIADKHIDETFELFSVSVIGTQISRLNVNLPPGGNVLDFKITPNSQWVVYRADQVANDAFALFAVPSLGGAAPVRVNPALVPGGDVHVYVLTQDNKGVLYLADQETDGVDELFATFDRLLLYLPLARH